jgi:hypothetical protein
VGTSRYLPLLCAALLVLPSCETERERQREEDERQDAKRLDDFYEIAWVQCVNDLGMDRCRVIQETGFQQCRNHRSSNAQVSGVAECLDARFADRLKMLPKASSTKEKEPDPDNPRAAPPVSNTPLTAEAPEPGAPPSEKF